MIWLFKHFVVFQVALVNSCELYFRVVLELLLISLCNISIGALLSDNQKESVPFFFGSKCTLEL